MTDLLVALAINIKLRKSWKLFTWSLFIFASTAMAVRLCMSFKLVTVLVKSLLPPIVDNSNVVFGAYCNNWSYS